MSKPDFKPILCLDFDGVIHAHKSGYQGARVIPDGPVDGALEFISEALEHFEVHIYSSRSHQWGGRRAMRRWLEHHMEAAITAHCDNAANHSLKGDASLRKHPLTRRIDWDVMEPLEIGIRDAARQFVKKIQWPKYKPPALVTIDDRALTFTGVWPTMDTLKDFKPWNRRSSDVGWDDVLGIFQDAPKNEGGEQPENTLGLAPSDEVPAERPAVEAMAEEIVEWFYEGPGRSYVEFLKLEEDELVQCHHGLGRHIRNHFKLWEYEWTPEKKDGVDHSPEHPDSISMEVIKEAWKRMQEDK